MDTSLKPTPLQDADVIVFYLLQRNPMFREARKAVCSDTGVGSSTSFPITSLLTCGVIQLLSLADVWLGPPSSSSAVPVVGQGPSPAGWDSQCLGSTDGSDQHLQGCSDSRTTQDVIIPWISSAFVLLLLVSLRIPLRPGIVSTVPQC